MKAITVHLYQFDELDDMAKDVARAWFKTDYPDHNWWESVYDAAREIATYFGVEIDKICFSGFWSQGDGACFTGTFRSDDIKTLNELKENYPAEEFLHSLLRRLLALKHPENSVAQITTSGRYSHAYAMNFGDLDEVYEPLGFNEIRDCLRSFADWIYAALAKEHDYLMSDECVDENITNNEYWFLVNGEHSNLGD